MKDHEIAQTVNTLRDIALEFRDAEQLRERIAQLIVPLLRIANPPEPHLIEHINRLSAENVTLLDLLERWIASHEDALNTLRQLRNPDAQRRALDKLAETRAGIIADTKERLKGWKE